MPTRYFLHVPRSTTVFSTTSPSISRFLRRRHFWAGFKSERPGIPDHVTTSCIRECENGELVIDEESLNGGQVAENYRALLRMDGFEQPDLRYVGRLVRGSRLGGEKTGKDEDEGREEDWRRKVGRVMDWD
jgi:hypothetical protein